MHRLLYVLEVTETEFIYRFTDDWSTHTAKLTDLPQDLQSKIKKDDWLIKICA